MNKNKTKRNEILAYMAGSKGNMVVIKLPYLERRNLKYKAKALMDKKFEGFRTGLGWKNLSKSWIDLYKEALDLILESNAEILVYNTNDPVEILNSLKKSVDRIYSSDIVLQKKDKELYFVRLEENIVGQLGTLISGIYGYLDILINDPEGQSAKAEITRYALDRGIEEKITYVL